MSKRVVLLRCALLSTVAVINSNCSSIDRLKAIGEQPPLSALDNPTTKPGYKPVQMPMPTPQPAHLQSWNSLVGATVHARSSRTSAPIRSATF